MEAQGSVGGPGGTVGSVLRHHGRCTPRPRWRSQARRRCPRSCSSPPAAPRPPIRVPGLKSPQCEAARGYVWPAVSRCEVGGVRLAYPHTRASHAASARTEEHRTHATASARSLTARLHHRHPHASAPGARRGPRSSAAARPHTLSPRRSRTSYLWALTRGASHFGRGTWCHTPSLQPPCPWCHVVPHTVPPSAVACLCFMFMFMCFSYRLHK